MISKKRQDVVDTATRLFLQYGFHPVGIDRIIAESGVARMTMYRHFVGKDDLVKEVLDQRHRWVIDEMCALIERVESPDEKLKVIFEWHETWFESPEFSGCLFERAISEFSLENDGISSVAVMHKKKLVELLESVLIESFPQTVAVELAETLVMLLDGATSSAHAFKKKGLARHAWRAAETLLHAARLRLN